VTDGRGADPGLKAQSLQGRTKRRSARSAKARIPVFHGLTGAGFPWRVAERHSLAAERMDQTGYRLSLTAVNDTGWGRAAGVYGVVECGQIEHAGLATGNPLHRTL